MLDSFYSADHVHLSRLAALAVCTAAALICLWLIVRLVWLLLPQGDVAASSVPAVAPTYLAPVQSDSH